MKFSSKKHLWKGDDIHLGIIWKINILTTSASVSTLLFSIRRVRMLLLGKGKGGGEYSSMLPNQKYKSFQIDLYLISIKITDNKCFLYHSCNGWIILCTHSNVTKICLRKQKTVRLVKHKAFRIRLTKS